MNYEEASLKYHMKGRPGKIAVTLTKPCTTQRDLALAYTPGVAGPCLRIAENPEDAFLYTARGNLVGVVTNGTAVLGLGDIGPVASKPVMEGKAVLFKRFADIDVFDVEIDTKDAQDFIHCVELLEPTFGGINLEDIKAPECFEIERTLKERMDIPVFHDDQHGTAIISGAALLNALELTERRIEGIRVVISGAGAAAIACANFYVTLGVPLENITLFDSRGVVHRNRAEGMNKYKARFAVDDGELTMESAMQGADVFLGLSIAGVVTPEMVKAMADRPIIFALANPNPEIAYEDARIARPDAIIGTGRSDYPNQINNVLGFPFLFRGALDVRASSINEPMKIAAANALAELTREPVPYNVIKAYGMDDLVFGPEYIIPKPLDIRVLTWVAGAVAQAAIESGVARIPIDPDQYRNELEGRLGGSRYVMRSLLNRARRMSKRIVFPEGDHDSILKACDIILHEGIARPVLLGDAKKIAAKMARLQLDFADQVEVIDPRRSELLPEFERRLFEIRQRKGMVRSEARRLVQRRIHFASLMVNEGLADGIVAGLNHNYPDIFRPALQIIGTRPDARLVAGMHMMLTKRRTYFFADTTVNINPTAEDLAEIAILCASEVQRFGVEPKVAMLSFSNFGSTRHPLTTKVRRAVEIVRERTPDLLIDGEMQVGTATSTQILDEVYPFSVLAGKGGPNVLIFPDLEASNIGYKLLKYLGDAEIVGPIVVGMRKPVHVLQIGDYDEQDVVNMTAIAVIDAA